MKSSSVPKSNAGDSTARFGFRAVSKRLSRWFGSIQLAIVLLSAFALVLFLGTVVESRYDGKVARQLVYQSWWFASLLGLLGINIFFAAAKKWPWKKHQTGFLITHLGLLCLVGGGMISSIGGISAEMVLVDSDSMQASALGMKSSNVLIDRNVQTIQVQKTESESNKPREANFIPGMMAWKTDRRLRPRFDLLTGVLGWASHPLPRRWKLALGRDVQLEVLNYYPHALRESYGPGRSERDLAGGFPVVKYQLSSPAFGRLPERWAACRDDENIERVGSAIIEFLGRNLNEEQLTEFQNPVLAENPAGKGNLVIGMFDRVHRFDIDEHLKQPARPIGDSGWKIQILEYFPRGNSNQASRLNRPGVKFALQSDKRKRIVLLAEASRQGSLRIVGDDPRELRELGLWVWYHPPDTRYGDGSIKGVLQFVADQQGGLHFRTLTISAEDGVEFEQAGQIDNGPNGIAIWKRKNWNLRILKFYPQAAEGPYMIPVNRRLGLIDSQTVPAIRCRLSVAGESKEFLLGKSEDSFTPVQVGDEKLLVRYGSKHRFLDFQLALERAEQTTARGSDMPATQTSFVLLTDPRSKIESEPRIISFNKPLKHRGYKFYQSSFQLLRIDENSKPVSRSTITVTHDPGVRLKYAGSTMVALGILCMFYMRAYFFKAKR